MLQQTQIATVTPYYHRFLEAFPTLEILAHARLERVLELWSGLGYYRRARSLHAAASVVLRDFGGEVPADYDLVRSLPGVGDYTARAILSIAYQQPLTLMDGNVARVISRLKALKGNIHQPRFRSSIDLELKYLLSPLSPGNFNQALMELGQTICLPRGPQCAACPWRKWCKGRKTGRPEAYPEPRPRRSIETHHLAVAIIRRGTRVALVRGLDEGLLSDLWNFPGAFGRTRVEALKNLKAKLSPLFPSGLEFGRAIGTVRHTITHRAIQATLYPAASGTPVSPKGLKWLSAGALRRSAVSQLARKISVELAKRI